MICDSPCLFSSSMIFQAFFLPGIPPLKFYYVHELSRIASVFGYSRMTKSRISCFRCSVLIFQHTIF